MASQETLIMPLLLFKSISSSTPADTSDLRKQLDDLLDETLDDAAFDALKAIVTPLVARIDALEAKPAPSPQVLELDRPFEDADFDTDWMLATQVIRDYTAWTWSTQLYQRVGRRVVKPLFPEVVESMPNPTHNNAIALGNNLFENRLPNNAFIRYTSPKTTQNSTDLVQFPASVFSHFTWILIDAAGNRVGSYGSNRSPLPSGFTGQSIDYKTPNPPDVVGIRVILTRAADQVDVTYDVPVS
jgi:hypothetical protein